MSSRLLGVLLALLTACARPARQEGVSDGCSPVPYGLTGGQTAAEVVGQFSLVLVAASGDSVGRTTAGTLLLDSTPRRDAVLAGSADVSVAAVGAFEVGLLDTAADSAPGVLVFESHGDRPSIMLRFGADANRQDLVQIEGAYTVLQVHRIGDAGFLGAWRSGTSMGGDLATGHFCATRRGTRDP